MLRSLRAAVYVGDTPPDITAGTSAGARAIGVATGSFTAAELRRAGAEMLLGTLEEFPAWYHGLGDYAAATPQARRRLAHQLLRVVMTPVTGSYHGPSAALAGMAPIACLRTMASVAGPPSTAWRNSRFCALARATRRLSPVACRLSRGAGTFSGGYAPYLSWW